jgi:RimJ/RimL family protein N-acetyltransferase
MPPPKVNLKRVETARLILRVPTLRDATKQYEEVRLSMARLAPWIPWAKKPPTLAKSRRYCVRAIKGHRIKKDFGFLMFTKKTGDLVGGIGLHRVDWTIPKLEIGYWIGTRFEGQGYVTEAVRALTEAAFKKLGAVRMELLCDGHNRRSRKVAKRAGYKLEGIHRQSRRDNAGKLCDMCVYAQTRPPK